MGVESRKSRAPPLPAPTETSNADSDAENEIENTELGSRVTDQSAYTIPDDGAPVTIATRKKKKHDKDNNSILSNNKSQTSLLIEIESALYNASDISSMPADSFLDGQSPERKRSRSLTRGDALISDAASGLAASAASEKLRTPSRRRSRSLSRERIVAQKAMEKVRGDRSEHRRKQRRSPSRSASGDKPTEGIKSQRRRSSRSQAEESLMSGADSGLLDSQVSRNSGYSARSGASKNSSINNPKLLETVEDAIRRLILPELSALKRESSKRTERRSSVGSGISSVSGGPRVTLNDGEVLSGKSRRDRNVDRVRDSDSPRSFDRDDSEEATMQDEKAKKKKSRGLETAALGAGVDEKKERRRRRKNHSRGNSLGGELSPTEERGGLDLAPPMPLMSAINPSDITRTSILSAESERPHSASSQRKTPVQELVARKEVTSPASRTPTRTPINLQHGLVSEEQNGGHSNAVKAGLAGAATGAAGLAALNHHNQQDIPDDEDSELLEAEPQHPYYQNTQEVPPPLRYVPYGHERRGLSPIQSVSGYTENEDGPVYNQRDSRLTQSGLSDSELTQDGDGQYWDEQHRENDRNRDFDSELSLENKRLTTHTDDSFETGDVSTGQNIKGVGGKPNFYNTPIEIESHVASLVNASEVTGTGSYPGSNSQINRKASYDSFDDESEKNFTSRGNSPVKSQSPRRYDEEYDIDENGRKIEMPKSHTKEKLGAGGLGAAAAALLAKARERIKNPDKNDADKLQYEERKEDTGAPLQKSFKDRAMDGQRLSSPRHSVDNLSEVSQLTDQPKMSASGLPDMQDPMPEIGFGDDASEEVMITGKTKLPHHKRSVHKALTSASSLHEAEDALIGAATGAGTAAALAGYNKEASGDHEDEWRRTSGERKRDTLITNPYEDTSPIAAIGNGTGLDRELLNQAGFQNANRAYNDKLYSGSPTGLPKDEGYISSAPNARSPGAQTPEQKNQNKGKGTDFMDKELGNAADADLGSPLYDSSTGNGIDRIQSKDIVALMDHLTVRDAQRSARDTEILVTLVRAAAEMRNSFEDMKRLLADTEDVIITEVQGTRKNRFKKSAEMYEDLPTKRRNVFRRALKGLSKRSTNDLGKIEDMLVQLLGDVEGLKVSQGLQNGTLDYDDFPEGRSEQDRGYPEDLMDANFRIIEFSTVPEDDEDDLSPHEEEILNNQFENDADVLTPTRETFPLLVGFLKYLAGPRRLHQLSLRVSEVVVERVVAKSLNHTIHLRQDQIQDLVTFQTDQDQTDQDRDRDREFDHEDKFVEPTRVESPATLRSVRSLARSDDKLHSGFSSEQLHQQYMNEDHPLSLLPGVYQVRHTVTKTHLESQAQNFDQPQPMSPSSINWGSSTSINRLPPNANHRYSQATTNTEGRLSPISDGGYSDRSASGQAPARPPKEPIVPEKPLNIRNKLTKPSPLSNEQTTR
ncbi:hypothetical protein DID88_001926 [Monilinia fructigena]|uniref:Uncharacterized protein n=1 Tax=Monilinia fructigena TaxID=38457 RepID=A0A395IVY8_9HELO|nr:hypothetical protein DID88_001926 [Monilinia fructigena]